MQGWYSHANNTWPQRLMLRGAVEGGNIGYTLPEHPGQQYAILPKGKDDKMKRLLICSAVAVLVLSVATGALAQGWFNVMNAKPNTVKLGLGYPTNSDIRDETSDFWLYLAYERVINEMPQNNSDITLEAAWANTSEVSVIPITVNWRQHNRDGRTYWGLGLGAFFVNPDIDVEEDDEVLAGTELAQFDGDGDLDNTTVLGYAGFFGWMSEDWQAELKYYYARAYGENVGSLTASVGYRF